MCVCVWGGGGCLFPPKIDLKLECLLLQFLPNLLFSVIFFSICPKDPLLLD